jgi:hypothetical protein
MKVFTRDRVRRDLELSPGATMWFAGMAIGPCDASQGMVIDQIHSQSVRLESRGTLAAPDAAMLALFAGGVGATGIAVTSATALRSSATAAAVRVIAETVGALPVHVFKRNPDGTRERFDQDIRSRCHRSRSRDSNARHHGYFLKA